MWYYLEEGQQRGPVMDADLAALHSDGKINSETMVWREGMANWQPLREAQSGIGGTATATAAPAGLGQVVCSQCGGTFPASEVIRYGSTSVCAACKPVFVQKLKEGANVAGGAMEFATFWTRFAAFFVDGVIVGIAGAIVGGIFGAIIGASGMLSGGDRNGGALLITFGSAFIGFLIRAAYFIYFTGKSGQTPGKKLCRIRVVNADGSQVSYAKATGRFFGYYLSALILSIGYLMMIWDDEKRTLHDRLCNTRVIKD
ncbi:MAG TPA: RDD family protein [Verrucomicrobiae bacterium]|nr:RDD family protein [Verrucomicrobiae bacterium]